MGQRRIDTDLPAELREHMLAIQSTAREYGLDFYDTVFEVLDFGTMNQIAAQGGFPIRYQHWKWGMEYESLSKRDAYGMGRIYEMVINNDPCYAYLQESNSITDQKLVMAHVYGHADFFKNNAWFAHTDRKMMNTMANHATRVQRHIDRRGVEPVERFIDACLSIEHLIDPHSVYHAGPRPGERKRAASGLRDHASRDPNDSTQFEPSRYPAKPYMDRFINPEDALAAERAEHEAGRAAARGRFPGEPVRDVLAFLLHHAPIEDWQADILSIIRDEAYYYAPQAMTKIMNEGWATYWHSKLMTGHFLEAPEIIDYADQHSGVVFMPAGGFNPYKIGVELFKDIERRWDTGQHGPEWERIDDPERRRRFDNEARAGRARLFEIRRIYNDVNFIDEFLTEEFVHRHRMYRYRRDPQTGEVRVVSRDWKQIKNELLARITNMGQPFIEIVDANHANRGELMLRHRHTGLDIDLAHAGKVLQNLALIWSRPVHLHATIDEKRRVFSVERPEGAMAAADVDSDA
ncbi:MAG: SpoVR family protein [Phycisphaerales bacterium]